MGLLDAALLEKLLVVIVDLVDHVSTNTANCHLVKSIDHVLVASFVGTLDDDGHRRYLAALEFTLLDLSQLSVVDAVRVLLDEPVSSGRV